MLKYHVHIQYDNCNKDCVRKQPVAICNIHRCSNRTTRPPHHLPSRAGSTLGPAAPSLPVRTHGSSTSRSRTVQCGAVQCEHTRCTNQNTTHAHTQKATESKTDKNKQRGRDRDRGGGRGKSEQKERVRLSNHDITAVLLHEEHQLIFQCPPPPPEHPTPYQATHSPSVRHLFSRSPH